MSTTDVMPQPLGEVLGAIAETCRINRAEAINMMGLFVPGYRECLTARKARRGGKRYVIGVRNPANPTDVATLGAGPTYEDGVRNSIERCLLTPALLSLFGLQAKPNNILAPG